MADGHGGQAPPPLVHDKGKGPIDHAAEGLHLVEASSGVPLALKSAVPVKLAAVKPPLALSGRFPTQKTLGNHSRSSRGTWQQSGHGNQQQMAT